MECKDNGLSDDRYIRTYMLFNIYKSMIFPPKTLPASPALAGHPQAKTSAGEPLFRVNFSKYKGECTAKPAKAKPTFCECYKLLSKIPQSQTIQTAIIQRANHK